MSIIIYFCAFLSTLLFVYIGERIRFKNKIIVRIGTKEKDNYSFQLVYTLIIFICPILLAAFRKGIGNDYKNYYNFFLEQCHRTVAQTEYSGIEYIFRLLTKIISLISENERFYFGVLAFLMFYFFYLFCYYQKDKISMYYILWYFLLIYYGMSYNIVRQTLAMCIVMFAIHYYIENKVKKYMILVTVAALFHTSALIMIPIYFLKFIDAKRFRKILRGLFLTIIVLFPFYYKIAIQFMMRYLKFYLGYFSDMGTDVYYSTFLYLFEKIILLIPIMLKKRYLSCEYRKLIYFLFVDLVLVVPMFSIPYLYRISYYFLIIYGMIIANCIKNSKGSKYYNIMVMYFNLFPIAFFILHYVILCNHQIYPYVI